MLGCLHQFQAFQLSHPQTLTISLGNLQMGQFFENRNFQTKLRELFFQVVKQPVSQHIPKHQKEMV